jgi:small membrane protein
MTPFQLIFAPLCFLTAAVLAQRVAQRRFPFWKGVFWAAIWAVGGAIILQPDLTTRAAALLGIGRGSDLLLYLTTLTGCYLFQRLYARTRTLENLLTEALRRQAIDHASFGSGTSDFGTATEGAAIRRPS